MVTLTLILGVALLGTAFALLVRATLGARGRALTTVKQIDEYGFGTAQAAVPPTTSWPLVDRLATTLGNRVARRLGGIREAEIRRELVAAGIYRTSPRKFMGYRALTAGGVPLVWFLLASKSGLSPIVLLLTTGFGAVIGWVVPMASVRRRAERRLKAIDHELPELVDLLVVTIEAGLGFLGSMQEAASRMHGPLGDELRLTLQEQHMGLAIDEALRNMLARADTPAMRSFVRGILQGETLGVSIGQIMRNLADEMRTRRRQQAEERAQRAPIKILFPLIFLIFPAMFIVLLAPAFFTFVDAFHQ